MILSVRQLHEEKERDELDTYQNAKFDDTRTTLGDLIGSKLQNELRGVEEEPEEIIIEEQQEQSTEAEE